MVAWLAAHLEHLNDAGEYSFWGYLASVFLIAAAYFLRVKRLTVRQALRRIFAKQVWLGPSARADYSFLAVNELLFRVPNAAAFAAIVNSLSALVVRAAKPGTTLLPASFPAPLTAALYTVFLLACLDFGSYLTHKMQHEIAFFWRFHAVHHSAEVMNPLTVFRQHPLDMAHYTLFRGVAAGLGAGLFALVFPWTDDVWRIAGVNALLFCFYLTAGLRHSHVPFAYPRALRYVFFSPHLHLLHHSRDPRHAQRNYGVIFAVWDRWFGSYQDETVPPNLRFGLTGASGKQRHSVLRMYLEPLGLRWRSAPAPAPPLPQASESPGGTEEAPLPHAGRGRDAKVG